MVDALLGAGKPRLKLRRIFSEIMQKAGEPRRFPNTDPLSEPASAIGRFDQVLRQGLPVQPALVPGGVGVVHGHNPSYRWRFAITGFFQWTLQLSKQSMLRQPCLSSA